MSAALSPPDGYTAEEWAAKVRAFDVLDFGYTPPLPKRAFDVAIPDVPTRYLEPLRPHEPRKRIANRTYIVQCQEFVKIGMASDVPARFRSLQAMNPLPLTMLAILPGGREVERKLHLRFRHYRHRDEWFNYEGELASWIGEGCPL